MKRGLTSHRGNVNATKSQISTRAAEGISMGSRGKEKAYQESYKKP